MIERVLRVLEFDKIKEELGQYVASSLGKEKARQLVPSFAFEEVKRLQAETDEAAQVIRIKGQVPLGGIFDIREHIKRAQIGGMLHEAELLNIASTIYGSRRIKKFIDDLAEEEEKKLPILKEYSDQIFPLVELERSIKNCIDDNGVVMDSASEKLRSLRQRLRSIEARIREKLENITRSSSSQKMLSDAIITIRNDRYVIPVKQEYRNAFGGMIHDQSSSGATLFIEPQAVVQLNNELRELKASETQEIERILRELSRLVADDSEMLLQVVEVLAALDFIFAKAFYGQKLKATKPELNDQGIIKINKARHPLIPSDEVVANDIELGEDYTAIVITGPNTGGKTVTLKTVGLLTLMAQSGLQIPALDGSKMAVFSSIFADIGDEQSIEQSLSTFSSHMTNIVEILKRVDFDSLVLFDELGAGTDPQEGAALAISILDFVIQRGARVIATTHYPELKAYGYNRKDVINASVEFNVETLSPTYRLLLGIPGRSNAFEISQRLGLDQRVIEQAKAHMSAESTQVETMIASLEASQLKAKEDLRQAKAIRESAEKLKGELTQKLEEFERERENLYKQAEEKANEALQKAKKEAEQIIANLRKLQKEAALQIKEHELIEAKKSLEEATPNLVNKAKQTKAAPATQKQLLPGDEVKVLSVGQKGHIVEQANEQEYIVQLGIMKMKVNVKELEYVKRPKEVETKPLATIRGSRHHVKPELDLRGERYEDAMLRVEKYIDDATLAGHPSVQIIHGKGTGALRKGVQELLKKHRSVKNFRLGNFNEGGSGVTVVELK